MKITVTKMIPKSEEVEVAFPFFVSWADSYEATSWETVARIDADGRMVSIKVERGRAEVEHTLTVSKIDLQGSMARYLDRTDCWPSTEEEFLAAAKDHERAIADHIRSGK